ncbi:MAG: ankyrin repeat domain-containing protein [Acidobacteria bacterium]|nr:ankyrin repeat domain-containing protein [Acidobacteriota bacterium]
MFVRVKVQSLWWVVSLLSVASLAAAGGDFRLAEAVQKGDKAAVRSLLQEGADVNEPLGDGATALAWAAHRDDLETAEMLIRAGADATAANDYGVTPLSLACTNRNSAMVEKLLEAGADPNAAQGSGETVLMTCARAGNLEAVKLLLARDGVDVDAKETNRGQTALMWAVAAKHPEVARVLIEHGADVNARSRVLELFAAKRVDFYGDDVHYATSKGGFSPLMFAARMGDVESARILLSAGANVNYATPEYGSVLVVASASAQEEVALLLLEKGAEPNGTGPTGLTALHWAVREGLRALSGNVGRGDTNRFWDRPNMPGLVKALLAYGANPNARIRKEFHPYNTPFHTRNMGNSLPQIVIVGATPFLLAAASGGLESMRLLVEGGADPRLAAEDGATALMVAAGVGSERSRTYRVADNSYRTEANQKRTNALEAAKLALQLGVDINAVEGGGRSVLHGASYLRDHEMIKFLVENGANLEAKDKYGGTPLSIALGDPEGLYYRNRGGGRYDDRFRVITGEDKETAELLLKLGAAPFTGKRRLRGSEEITASQSQ